MIINNKSLKNISNHKYARNDVKYHKLSNNVTFNNYVLLKDIFDIINGSVQTTNYVPEITNIPYIRIGDLSYKYGLSMDAIQYLDSNTKIDDTRIIKDGDLILATIGATVGKVCCGNNVQGGTHSNNTVILRAKNNTIKNNIVFYERLFQTDLYINYIFNLSAQKAQPNLQLYEIKNIKIPVVNETIISKAISKCNKLSQQINNLNSTILSTQSIIDKVFQTEFGFNYEKLEYLKKMKKYNTSLSSFGNNPDLRYSVKFHRPAGKFAMKQICDITNKKLKHFISEPITLGTSISPKDFDDYGKTAYISMATIKNWDFNYDNAAKVSDNYASSKKLKTIKNNDIILARSGEGTIGKVALISCDDNLAIFSDFTMRIRFDKSKYNPKFAYYYFRTKFFQYLIEIYKKGLGNNTNIFPIVVQEFPIPDISLSEQQNIIDKIQKELTEQDKIKQQIVNYRNQIDEIILTSIN